MRDTHTGAAGDAQGWCIREVKSKVQGILQQILKLHSEAIIRVAFVGYRDYHTVNGGLRIEVRMRAMHRAKSDSLHNASYGSLTSRHGLPTCPKHSALHGCRQGCSRHSWAVNCFPP